MMNFISCGRCVRNQRYGGHWQGVQSAATPGYMSDEESCRNLMQQYARRPPNGTLQTYPYYTYGSADSKPSCCRGCMCCVVSIIAFAAFITAGYYFILTQPKIASAVSPALADLPPMPFELPDTSALPFQAPSLEVFNRSLLAHLPSSMTLSFRQPAGRAATQSPEIAMAEADRGIALNTTANESSARTSHANASRSPSTSSPSKRARYDCSVARTLLARSSNVAAKTGADAAIKAWRKGDQNGDHQISQQELLFIKADKDIVSPRMAHLLSVADSNKDTMINVDEFVAALTSDPTVASLTKDGILDFALASSEVSDSSEIQAWSTAKREWCCKFATVGCQSDVTSKSTTDSGFSISVEMPKKKYDCNKEYANWMSTWSKDKKDWCCWHEQRGCAMMHA